jgi:hypothetical protein
MIVSVFCITNSVDNGVKFKGIALSRRDCGFCLKGLGVDGAYRIKFLSLFHSKTELKKLSMVLILESSIHTYINFHHCILSGNAGSVKRINDDCSHECHQPERWAT